MIRFVFVPLLLFSVLVGRPARAGNEVVNGGGLAEQNFAYALAALQPLYEICFLASSCLTTPDQRSILKGILESLPAERATPSLLRFETGTRRFHRDGQVRIAVTGSTVGSPIYINRDMIYHSKRGKSVALSVGEAIGILTHELGHHQGVVDHNILDILGGNLRAFFELARHRISVDNFGESYSGRRIYLSLLHPSNLGWPGSTRSLIWFHVDDEVYDLNDALPKEIKCPAGWGTRGGRLDGFRLSHVSWGERVWVPGKEANNVVYPLRGTIWIQCDLTDETGAAKLFLTKHDFDMLFHFRIEGSQLNYHPENLYIHIGREKNRVEAEY
jgi:hypothetical protein